MDFAHARDVMVESQVRPNDVTDPRVLHAMRTLPRERFVPPQKRALAYGDLELEVASGRFLMRPRDLSKLIAALAPAENDRALEIAGATGYGAAVLATCCKEVLSLDPDPNLSITAGAALESVGVKNAKAVSMPVSDGWRDEAPYDVTLLNGAAEIIPEAWFTQLAPGGRLGVIVRQGAVGSARIYTKSGDVVGYRAAFDAAPPIVPGLERKPSFVF